MDEEKIIANKVINEIGKKNLSVNEFNNLKIKLSKRFRLPQIISNSNIYFNLDEKSRRKYKTILETKPIRSISGVSVIAIMTKPEKCKHGTCIMCPGGPNSYFKDVPQSYTGNEPASIRAIRNNFDPYLQVFNRLEQYIILGKVPDKVELIIMGGTFPSLEKDYRDYFLTYTYKAFNDFSELFFKENELDFYKFKEFFELPSSTKDRDRTLRINNKIIKLKKNSSLELEKSKNECSKIRCIGLTIETKGDYGKFKQGNELLEYGCTRVELGVQSVYDDVLKKINRGHNSNDTIESIQILKDLGFKINAHFMIGLPYSSKEMDVYGLKELFMNQDYRPDMVKIYPCLVLPGTPLFELWKNGKYKPIETDEAAHIIANFKKDIPEYCRIMRIQRDIPTKVTSAGPNRTNLRQYVFEIMKKNHWKCRCIRCRESGRNNKPKKIEIVKREYKASNENEIFISLEDKKNDLIIGFCRLRIPYQLLRKEINNKSALIRELHIYSSKVNIGNKPKENELQHRGYGKTLINEAEKIAREDFDKNKIVILSGIGVRQYYKEKLGYKQEGPYVSKILN